MRLQGQSFICNILTNVFIRVMFIITASFNILFSFFELMGGIFMGSLFSILSVAVSILMIKLIAQSSKTGYSLTSVDFQKFIGYYGFMVLSSVFSSFNVTYNLSGGVSPLSVVNIIISLLFSLGFIFMIVADNNEEAVKNVNYAGAIILYCLAIIGAHVVEIKFIIESFNVDFENEMMNNLYLISILVIFFIQCIYNSILPVSILVWMGKHKNDNNI